MRLEMRLNDIKADMEAISRVMVTKYETVPSEVAENGIEVALPEGVCLDDVIDDLEALSWLAEDISNMFEKLNTELYNVLCIVRDEPENQAGLDEFAG